MLEVREMDIDKITEAVNHILSGRVPEAIELPVGYPENEVKQLAQHMNVLLAQYRDCAGFMFAVSRGDLDFEAPKSRMRLNQSLKNLQANLRHLTWKIQQIASGDFTQRVDFMGEFSTSFNPMVEQLAVRAGEVSMECIGKAGFAGFGFLAAMRKHRLVQRKTAPRGKIATLMWHTRSPTRL